MYVDVAYNFSVLICIMYIDRNNLSLSDSFEGTSLLGMGPAMVACLWAVICCLHSFRCLIS